MNIYEFGPIKLLISGAYWLVTTLSDLLEPLAGAQSAALAIVALTLAVRLLLVPVGRSQAKATADRQRLAPQLAELKRRYKNPEFLQRKTMELYKNEKTSPFAGCLPVLAQLPVLMAVYGLFILPTIDGGPNALLSHTLFGVPLDATLLGAFTGATLTLPHALVGLGIMTLVFGVTLASRKLLTPAAAAAQVQPAKPAAGLPELPDMSGVTRAMSFVPFVTVFVVAFVPLAAALYLATTTVWTLCERLVLGKIYGTLPSPHSPVAA